jgi:hypothetical protein
MGDVIAASSAENQELAVDFEQSESAVCSSVKASVHIPAISNENLAARPDKRGAKYNRTFKMNNYC